MVLCDVFRYHRRVFQLSSENMAENTYGYRDGAQFLVQSVLTYEKAISGSLHIVLFISFMNKRTYIFNSNFDLTRLWRVRIIRLSTRQFLGCTEMYHDEVFSNAVVIYDEVFLCTWLLAINIMMSASLNKMRFPRGIDIYLNQFSCFTWYSTV